MDSPTLAAHNAFQARLIDVRRASRSATRRALAIRRIDSHPLDLVAARAGNLAVYTAARELILTRPVRRARSVPAVHEATRRTTLARRAVRAVHAVRPAVPQRHAYRVVVTRHAFATRATRRVTVGGGMSAVIAYARSQVGRRYVTGGIGGSGFDCSGLTQQAYAQAGIALPHSSRAQAAQAHGISRRQARAGDLVIGNGHVGIYMGHGMMIDAGNHRTGVVYRKLFSGLRVGRL